MHRDLCMLCGLSAVGICSCCHFMNRCLDLRSSCTVASCCGLSDLAYAETAPNHPAGPPLLQKEQEPQQEQKVQKPKEKRQPKDKKQASVKDETEAPAQEGAGEKESGEAAEAAAEEEKPAPRPRRRRQVRAGCPAWPGSDAFSSWPGRGSQQLTRYELQDLNPDLSLQALPQ